MNFFQSVDEAILRIHEQESRQEQLANELKNAKDKPLIINAFQPESVIRQTVSPSTLNETLVGVDSGFVPQELPFVDVMLVRATAAIFTYENDSLIKTNYEPNGYQFPAAYLSSTHLERDEWGCLVSIQRLMKEWQLAKICIEQYHPAWCFIDGSLVPQFMDKPRENSPVMIAFKQLILLVQSVYETARKNNCTLVGTVEDSRSKRLNECWQDAGIISKNDFSDTVLLSKMLHQNERTNVVSYTEKRDQHPILSEMKKEWGSQLFTFYLRPSAYDWPLRVEIITPVENAVDHANRVASTVLRQSMLHKEYAYPAVLIEADLKSRLTPSEIDLVMSQLYQKMGSTSQLTRRRDHRPFG